MSAGLFIWPNLTFFLRFFPPSFFLVLFYRFFFLSSFCFFSCCCCMLVAYKLTYIWVMLCMPVFSCFPLLFSWLFFLSFFLFCLLIYLFLPTCFLVFWTTVAECQYGTSMRNRPIFASLLGVFAHINVPSRISHQWLAFLLVYLFVLLLCFHSPFILTISLFFHLFLFTLSSLSFHL